MPSVSQLRALSILLVITIAALGLERRVHAAPGAVSAPARRGIAPAFVRNAGSADPSALFVAVGGGRPIFFTSGDVRIVDPMRQRSLWLTLVGAHASRIEGDRPTSGVVTQLSKSGARREPAFRDVVYRAAWPGVDARIGSGEAGIEYAFEVAAGADPSAIRLQYRGADRVSLNDRGELVLDAGGDTIVDRAPIAYQRAAAGQIAVPVRFIQRGADIGFAVGEYDRTQPLVIDPTLVYSTYLGGSGADLGRAIAVDATGAAYIAGITESSDFPVTPGAFQTAFRGGAGSNPRDVFVAKINAAGTHFDYVTYLGGSGNDEAFGVAVDAGGNAYVTGFTESSDFPTTAGAFRTTIAIGGHDGFVAKLNATGSGLVYSTYFGAFGTQGSSIAVDASGSAYVAGFTVSSTLPVTAGAIMPPRTSSAQQIDDAYLLKLSPDGASVVYGTYIAGAAEDVATGVAIDPAGHAIVTGWTKSLDLVTTSGSVQPAPNSASFRSTDGGQTFTADNGGIRAASVGAVAIDPQQPSNVYEASPDAGVLKSTDGGATWSRVFSGPASDIAISPIAPSTLFAVASNGTSTPFLARSTDAGASWTVVLPVVAKVALAASNPSTLYVIRGGGDVVKSTDSGNTWTTVLASAGALSLAVDPTNASIAYVGLAASQVKKTTDGGVTWRSSTVPSFAPSTVDNVAVDPTLPSVVWASVQNSLFKSADGGASWSSTLGPAGHRVAFDGGTMYATGGIDGVLQKTTDRGGTWTTLTLRGNTVAAFGLAANAGVVFVGIKAHVDSFAYKIDTGATTGAAVLMYGTYLGGTLDDTAAGVAIDSSGNAVIALQTASIDLPVTAPTAQRVMALARLAPDGASYRAFTWAGAGSSYSTVQAVVADRAGFAYMVGADADGSYYWIDQVDPTGVTTISYNAGGEAVDQSQRLAAAVDAASSVYVIGAVYYGGLATTATAPQPGFGGVKDAFVEKFAFADSTTDFARGRPAVASSIEASQYAAANAVDGDPTTRWSSQWSDPQWIYVDLGQRVQIDHVVLRWETAYGREYAIQVSDDAVTWTDPPHVFSRGGTDVIGPMRGVVGRYVRMYGFQRGTQWGYSLWSFEVYGAPVSTPPPPSALPSPWKSADVGAVGMTGSASYANGTFDVSGAGADIWGTSDAFQFVYQPISGDQDIVASVDSLQNTNPYAKAGLMFRESLDPGSRHVILDMRPDGSIEFMMRDTTGGATTFLASGSHAFPAQLRLRRAGTLITAFIGSGGGAWQEIGHITVAMAASLDAGLAVTSHDTSRSALATFSDAFVTPLFENWPAPWTDDDIGAVGRAGSASYASGTFTVNGSGADIWGTADAFNYVSQPTTGDFSIVAHVAGVQNTNPYAKAGVDMRDTKTASSAHVILDVRPDGSIEFMQRAANGASTTFIAGGSHALPVYLMLVREGTTVTGAISSDGNTFTPIGQTTVAIAATTFAGMAVTSHDTALLNTSVFDAAYVVNYAIHTQPQPPQPQPATNIVVYANDVPATSIHGSWTRTSDATAAAGVKLATPDAGLSNTNAPLANPVDYVDVTFNATASTPYTMWLRLKATANSKSNDSAWIQFSNAEANGSAAYRIGSPNGLLVNLATDSTGSSLNGWGWQNGAYWLSQATTVTFPSGGTQTLRIQVREDGVQFDQIVLSPSQYRNAAPGPASNDATIVPK